MKFGVMIELWMDMVGGRRWISEKSSSEWGNPSSGRGVLCSSRTVANVVSVVIEILLQLDGGCLEIYIVTIAH